MIVVEKFREIYNDETLPSIKNSFFQYSPEDKIKILNYPKK